MNLLVGIGAVSFERTEREAAAQTGRSIGRARAECSQLLGIAVDAGDDFAVRLRIEGDVTGESGRQGCRRCPPSPGPRSAQAVMPSGMRMHRIDFALQHRPVAPSELHRYVVESAGSKTAIEMPQSRDDHAHHRDFDVGTRLIKHQKIKPLALGELDAGHHLLALVESGECRTEVWPDPRIAVWYQGG